MSADIVTSLRRSVPDHSSAARRGEMTGSSRGARRTLHRVSENATGVLAPHQHCLATERMCALDRPPPAGRDFRDFVSNLAFALAREYSRKS
jgi:hypothetical protein